MVKQQVMMEVRQALFTLASAKEQLSLSQVGVQAALSELDLAQERFRRLSAATSLELTNALYAVSRAREIAVEALFRLNASRMNLAREQGQLDRLD